jgi:tryptophan-rich sensory protein
MTTTGYETSLPPFSVKQQTLGLFTWIVVCFAFSALGAAASIQARSFYGALTRPEWAPPGWLFGPVWTVLYLMMAIAAWMIWRRGGFAANRVALSLFVAQLAFNALWTWMFFAWQLGALAFVEVLLLWALIATVIVVFYRKRALAAVLLVPYLMWVSFASALTYSLWQLNPQILA